MSLATDANGIGACDGCTAKASVPAPSSSRHSTRTELRSSSNWLREPELGHGSGSVSRYWMEVYRERADLRAAFPDLARQIEPFKQWIELHGHEMGDIRGLSTWEDKDPATLAPAGITAESSQAEAPWGVNVAGFLQSELGVGEAARGIISALDAVRVPVLPVHGRWRPNSRQDHAYAMFDTDAAIFPVNIVCVNADVLALWMAEAGDHFRAGRYTIGLWWWEVNVFPGAWLPAFDLVDEVWVATQHVADSLMPVSSVPVTKVTMPVSFPPVRWRARADLGLPEGFLFMFIFDYHSVFERKNPLAIVKAFKRAFPAGSGASLVVKSINHEQHVSEHERLLLAAAEHPDIHLIDRYVTADEKNSMIASADCYVSLHRAEGFGLTMAEAMWLGKPVIATRYGGNLEFMNDRNSWLVDHEMIAIRPGCYPYPETGSWADPDVVQAVHHMRTVFENDDEVRRRAAMGQGELHERHSAVAAGVSMERRLEHLRKRHPGFPLIHDNSKPTAEDQLTTRVQAGPLIGARSRFGMPGKLGRRVVLRGLKPYTVYQQGVNADISHTLATLDTELATLNTQLDRRDVGIVQRQAALLAELRNQARAISPPAIIDNLLRSVNGLEIAVTDLQQAITAMPDLTHRVMELTKRLEGLDHTVNTLEWQGQATPYMNGSPFAIKRHPVAGIVQGYFDASGPSEHPYRSFEDIFRGPEPFIRDRQRAYMEILDGRDPVLDFGCGRGEFLDLLRDADLRYLAVDLDPGMVARCHEKGHDDVVLGDGLEFLEGLDDDSLGVVFAAQVIEHFPYEPLLRFLELACTKLRPDGLLIAETVNPHSGAALKTFWVDLTHTHPIFPEVALALCQEAGFPSAYIFHPGASGNVEQDRFTEGAYAVVASVAERAQGSKTPADQRSG